MSAQVQWHGARGGEVLFSAYDGGRGLWLECRAQLHADCLATLDWAALEVMSGTRAPQWVLLAPDTEDYAAAAEHLEALLGWAAEHVAGGTPLQEALGWAAARSDSLAAARELADWREFRASEREVPL